MLAWRIPKREELVGYCPQGYKELKRAERLSKHAMSTPGRKEKENRGESPLFNESIMKKRQNWSKKQSSNSTDLTEFQLKVLKKMGIILIDENIID